jgi:hypothetical protein
MVKGTARSAPATPQIQPQKITDSRSTRIDGVAQHGHAKAQGFGAAARRIGPALVMSGGVPRRARLNRRAM